MRTLEDIWKNVNVGTDIKTLWFENPEEATDYLESLVKDLSSDVPIANEDDEEIDMNELLKLFDDYRKSQENTLYFRLVEGINDYISITLECWNLQSDCDCCMDVLTFSKYEMIEEKFIVRQYDGFDNEWFDISKPVTKEEATNIWNRYTNDGTENTCFDDIDYYEIFPADTIMRYSSKEGRQND